MERAVRGGMGMVFDRFKSWKNPEKSGNICPSCQHVNPHGHQVCTRCYYQIDRPAFEQSISIDEQESTDLLDELMSEIEENEGEGESIPASFAMDDLTVEVEQYGEDEQVSLSSKPDIQSMIEPPEEVEEEEYELTSDDIPLYVQKFEVPQAEEKEVELEQRKIELIQPNAETPETIQTVSASEVPDTNGWTNQNLDDRGHVSGDFDGDGRVDEFEAAFSDNAEKQYPQQEIPNAPSVPIPRLTAEPILEEFASVDEKETTPNIPLAPSIGSEESEKPLTPNFEQNTSFWPWHQQEEWPAPVIIKQLQAAIRSAKEQNTAQATVLLDEVGPHLGNRTSLVYSVGRLLMSIGRSREARQMVETAFEHHPDDTDVARAREKLIS
tara:strand:+ start:3144 stop:4289 length:1146 start_codon:yes stop_codon:yes gene_type:complete